MLVAEARNSLVSAVAGVFGLGRDKAVAPKEEERGPQRRHLPVQAGTKADRNDADALTRLESESAAHAIEAGLWKYHRLIPPPMDSKRYFRFQLMLEYFLYYTSFWMPLRVAFFADLQNPAWVGIDSVSYFIDACYWLDILLCTRTAYYDHSGDLVTDARTIFVRYLEYWFWVDVFASMPWELITGVYEVRASPSPAHPRARLFVPGKCFAWPHTPPNPCPVGARAVQDRAAGASVAALQEEEGCCRRLHGLPSSDHHCAPGCRAHTSGGRERGAMGAAEPRARPRGGGGLVRRACSRGGAAACVRACARSFTSSSSATGSRASGGGSARWRATSSQTLATRGSSATAPTRSARHCPTRRSTRRPPRARCSR